MWSKFIVVISLLLSAGHGLCLQAAPTGKTAAKAETKPFRFVQLTDIHLNPNGRGPAEALRRTIGQINAMDSIAFVVVTGDLTEHGDRQTMERVKAMLDNLTVPYHVCLGNHETTWSESGCTAFSEVFGAESYKFEYDGVAFLAFNTGPLMRMAYGHVSPADIAWLQRELTAYAAKGMNAILVTHYPLTEGDVDNWYEVTDAVRRPGNVRLFIGGHYHQVKNLTYDGIPGILMRSGLKDSEGHAGFGLYEVNKDEIKAYVMTDDNHKTPCGTYRMDQTVYDSRGKADKYPNFSDNDTFRQVKEAWAVKTDGAFYCSPAVEKGKAYIGDGEGRIRCFSVKDGKMVWEYKTGRRIVGGPAVGKGMVVCGSADGYIYGLKAKTGCMVWKVKASAPVLGYTSIRDGTAYVGASDSTFRAIDAKTGKAVWTYKGVKGYIVTRPLTTHDKVIFGAWDNTLYALDRKSGKEMWKWTGGIRGMHLSPAQVWPVEANGMVFITDPQRAMTAIDIETGQTVWRTYQSKVRETIGLSQDRRRLYSKTMQDSLVCYSAEAREKPVELWACCVGFGYEHGPSMPVEKDGIVYETTKEGLVFAVEGKTGRLLWRHKVGNSLLSTPVALSGGRVMYSSTDGSIGILQTKKQK